MKNAERIVMVLLLLVLGGGAAWGYFAVQDKRADYRERVANGEFEIREEEVGSLGVTASTTDQSNWQAIYPNTVPMMVGNVAVQASVADTLSSRIKGLSDTPYLPDNVVKLFAFGVAGSHSIWMKDMQYALDIIWVDQHGAIIHFEEAVSPASFPKSFGSPTPAWFVIEANTGFVAANDIKIGDEVIIPRG
jgi:uncharacterized membrane protein (UPF0127 family)